MAYRRAAWTQLATGQVDVSEDKPKQYFGRRAVQWVRLAHKDVGKTLFFLNHHGPLPVGTGGVCGPQVTAENILRVVAENSVQGDVVVVVGDFNSGVNSQVIQFMQSRLWHVFSGTFAGGIDHIFSNLDGEAIVKTMNIGQGGSDHDAIFAVLSFGPNPSARVPGAPTLPPISDCSCDCSWATKPGACAVFDATCCHRKCCPRSQVDCTCGWLFKASQCVAIDRSSPCQQSCCNALIATTSRQPTQTPHSAPHFPFMPSPATPPHSSQPPPQTSIPRASPSPPPPIKLSPPPFKAPPILPDVSIGTLVCHCSWASKYRTCSGPPTPCRKACCNGYTETAALIDKF